jgi:[protein-PII] uridylyltransferase
LLVHDVKAKKVAKEVEPIASAIWYPLWDSGVKLGHAVRRIDEQLDLASTDLDSATALVSARPLAGDEELAAHVITQGLHLWRTNRTHHLGELRRRVRGRQDAAGDVAYRLEPDLKDGHGGLRDVQSLWWAEAAGLDLIAEDLIELDRSYDMLLRARVALHLATGRAGDVLRLEDQDAAAGVGGWRDADDMMADVAAAGRTIAWLCDENWGRAVETVTGEPDRAVAPGVIVRDGEIELASNADPAADGTLVLKTAVAAARHQSRIGRATLDRLHDEVVEWEGNWPVGATDDLIALLLEGHRAIPVLESLDQRNLVARLLPEWAPVRSRPQRNAYHRFTVDRHLWEPRPTRRRSPDRCRVPTCSCSGRCSTTSARAIPAITPRSGWTSCVESVRRLGLVPADVDILVTMVEQHLLLPDVAMRRDLTDPVTIEQVADAVGTVEVLDLLHALTEADSLATGPSAWGDWKEELVTELAARVRHVLGGGDVSEVTWRLFPDAETLAVMAAGEVHRRASVTSSPWSVRTLPEPSAGSPACCRCTGSTWSPPGRTPTRAEHGSVAVPHRRAPGGSTGAP